MKRTTISPANNQVMDLVDLSHLNEVLDRIQNLAISSLVYDQIGCKADDREIYIPPSIHLVAMVKDLTNVLNYCRIEKIGLEGR